MKQRILGVAILAGVFFLLLREQSTQTRPFPPPEMPKSSGGGVPVSAGSGGAEP